MKSLPITDGGKSVRLPKDGQSLSSSFLTTMADTTWRIFLPVTLFVGLGLWFDLNHQATKPWATLVGLAIGFVLAALLVRIQIKRVSGK